MFPSSGTPSTPPHGLFFGILLESASAATTNAGAVQLNTGIEAEGKQVAACRSGDVRGSIE